MGKYLVTNKRRIKVEGPVCWDEVDTDSYQTLMSIEGHDIIDIISTLYHIDHDLLANCDDQEIIGPLTTMAQFVYTESLETLPLSEWFIIDKQAYKIRKNVGAMSFGQMVVLRKAVDGKTLNECVSFACAVYLQPYIDGGVFNLDRAKEIENEIKKLPITKTYPLGFFFLSKLSKGGNLFMNAWTLLIKMRLTSMIRLLSLRGLTALRHMQI